MGKKMRWIFEADRIATMKLPLQSLIVFVFLPVKEKKKITLVLFLILFIKHNKSLIYPLLSIVE